MSRPRWHDAARRIGGGAWVPFQIADALQAQLDAATAELRTADQNLVRHQEALREAATQIRQLREAPQASEQQRRALVERIRLLEDALRLSRAEAEACREAAEVAREKARAAAKAADELAGEAAEEEAIAARTRRALDATWEQAPALAARVAKENAGVGEYRRQAQELTADLARALAQREQALDRGRNEERVVRLRGLASLTDQLRRAAQSAPASLPRAWRDGQTMVLGLAEDELRAAGAERFGEVGEPFDPRAHEAIALDPETEEGLIARVDRPGYRLVAGELIRPAQVVVGSGAAS